jgi:hypothetical protein
VACTWTITGDNSRQEWNTAVLAGTLRVAKGVSLAGCHISIEVGATLSLADGASVGMIQARSGAVIDMGDGGAVGTATATGPFVGPCSGSVTFKVALSSKGADKFLMAGGPGNTYWYLTGTTQLFATAGERFERFAGQASGGDHEKR